MKRSVAVIALMAGMAGSAYSQFVYDEDVDGDISGDRFNPTVRSLSLGTNWLVASSRQGDREYITLNVPVGMQLEKIVLMDWLSLDQIGFIAVQQGTTFTEPPTGTNVANLYGYSHFGPGAGNVGQDILPAMGQAPGAIGFVPPLASGPYTYWMQQTGPNNAHYHFDFVVGVVPEPATMAVFGIGALAALVRSRRK